MAKNKAIKFYLFFLLFCCAFVSFSQMDSLTIDANIELGLKNIRTDSERAAEIFEKAIKDANAINYKKGKVDALINLGFVIACRGGAENYKTAMSLLEEAQKIAIEIEYNKGTGMSYLREGVVYFFKNEYSKAVEKYLESIVYLEKAKDTFNLIGTYQNLGLVHSQAEQFKNALANHKSALFLAVKSNDSTKVVTINLNIGWSYYDMKNYNSSLSHFKDLLATKESWMTAEQVINVNAGISSCLLRLKKYDESLKHGYLSEKLLEQGQFSIYRIKTVVFLNVGEANLELNNLDIAAQYFDKVEQILATNYDTFYKMLLTKNLAKLNNKKGNFEKAYHHSEYYNVLRDSIRGEKNTKIIANITGKYEAEKKNKLLIAQENKILKQSRVKNEFIALSIALIVSMIYMVVFYRQRQKTKNKEIEGILIKNKFDQLKSVIQGEEKERNRLAKELHDGINGDLVVIKHKIASMDTLNLIPENIDKIISAINLLDDTCDQIRNISHNLIPPVLINYDLIKSVNLLCKRTSEYNGLELSFQHFGRTPRLEIMVETAIYRIIQELITNVVKHAQATEGLVQINNHDDKTLNVTVEDNGVGFDLGKENTGIGLKNVKSRFTFLDAEYFTESDTNGTTTSFTLHLDHA